MNNVRHSTIRRIAVFSAAFVLFPLISSAFADAPSICVTNDAQLASALQIAQSTPLTIQLVQGTYHFAPTVWSAPASPAAKAKFSDGSSLLGGYIDSSCLTRNVGVNNTVISSSRTGSSRRNSRCSAMRRSKASPSNCRES